MGRCNLHIKIDSELRLYLEGCKQKLRLRSISRVVKYFLEKCRPLLEQHYFEAEEHASRYEAVNNDRALSRVSLHVYLDEGGYRMLKHYHQDLNFYSIAQIVRWVIRIGIAMLEHGVEEAERCWQELARVWKEKQQSVRARMYKVVQLFSAFGLQLQDLGWVSIYNRKFSPLRWIFLKE